MPERPPRRSSPIRPFDVDTVTLMAELPKAQGDAVAQLTRERDHLFLLHEALIEVAHAPTLEGRLQLFVQAIRQLGFDRVMLTLRDADLNPTSMVSVGLSPAAERELRETPTSGEVWRRRMPQLERFRISQSWYLDARDPWVSKEFRQSVPSELLPGDDPDWSPHDSLVVPLRGSDGRLVATLSLDDPDDRRRPSLTRVRIVELFGQQVAYCIEQASLFDLARRRAARLQRLQEVGTSLARSLDEREITRELARQISRVVSCDGVVIAHPDLESGRTTTALRVVHGIERPRNPTPLLGGPIGVVARSGRPVVVSTYDPERSPLAAADDVVGDAGPAASVLAVPMMAGIRLVGVIAVHSSARAAYGPEDEEVLLTIGAQAAIAITNARLYADSQREQRQSEALADVARAVGGSLRLTPVLQLILRHAVALLHSEGACIAMREGDYLNVVAAIGGAELLAGVQIPIEGSMSGRALKTGEHVVSNDVSAESDAYRVTQRLANIGNTLIVPLATSEGPIGILSVINRVVDFTEGDARILQRLADQVAVAVVNARLFEEVAEATREWGVAFDTVASGLVILDASGRVARCNPSAAAMMNAAGCDELAGRAFLEALLADPRPADDNPVGRAIAERQVTRGRLCSSSRKRLFDVIASPHPNGGAVVTFEDVTDRVALAERHQLVVETAREAIVITDRDRRIAFANPAATALFGGTSDIVGRPVAEFVPPEFAQQVSSHEDRGMAGEPQRYEAQLLRLDGERRTVVISTSPLHEAGQITGVVACLRDVSDERRARDAVAQSEARYRNLFETASDAIYTVDPHGYVTSANVATSVMVGRPREALLGRSVMAYLAPDEVEAVKLHFSAVLGGESRHYECHMLLPEGGTRLLSVANTPIRRGRTVIGVLGVARDVTAERERAAALARSEARYTRLVESASDGIITLDDAGRFTSVNRAFEIATGKSRAALIGTSFTDTIDPEDRDIARRLLVQTLHGRRERAEVRYIGADGDTRNCSVITTPVAEEGVIVGGLAVIRDVTEERTRSNQLVQQEKLTAIGQLVSGVAHELNNPLAAVLAFSQLLLASPELLGEQHSAVETIQQEAKRAAKIVASLLTFARQHRPTQGLAQLNQIVLDTVELRRYALRMKQIEVELKLDDALPSTWADAFQLQQVVLHILSNAEQALSDWPGERRITIRSWSNGDQLHLSVADCGPGIGPETLPRIFNPFFTTRPTGQASGLGLSISDGIVRQHGGRIRVQSRLGAGATFTVEMPVSVPPRNDPSENSVPDDGRLVLVVETDAAVRAALSGALGAAGHNVEAVASAGEAEDRLMSRRYDLVLLDAGLPERGAREVLDRLRRRDRDQASRVVLTGTADDELSLGDAPARRISRPIDVGEIALLVRDSPGLMARS